MRSRKEKIKERERWRKKLYKINNKKLIIYTILKILFVISVLLVIFFTYFQNRDIPHIENVSLLNTYKELYSKGKYEESLDYLNKYYKNLLESESTNLEHLYEVGLRVKKLEIFCISESTNYTVDEKIEYKKKYNQDIINYEKKYSKYLTK